MKRKWFEVDVEGLRELQEGKPKHFIARELIQNAFDENVTYCAVITKWDNGYGEIVVKDDSPEGFRNLADAFTLFGSTYKRADATKRGRFNLGEKQAIAVCDSAEISTTKGTVEFSGEGRKTSNKKTDKGSVVTVRLKINRDEYDEMLSVIKTYLPPMSVMFTVNGEEVKYQEPHYVVEAVLPTEIEQDGALRPTRRKTRIHILKPRGKAMIYEMGIPICEIECSYDIDIQQKVPLTPERENVTQAYLSQAYAHVLNAMRDELDEEGAGQTWTRQAVENPNADPETVKKWVTKLFGDKVVVANVKDKNSIDEAISHGYRVVYAKELPKGIWDNVKQVEGLMPSSSALFGQITVGAKHYEPTADMLAVARLTKKIADRILGLTVEVEFLTSGASTSADYSESDGIGTVRFNVERLGKEWFKPKVSASILDLIIHEVAHHAGNHTEHCYHETVSRMGAELVIIALQEPDFFKV